VRRNALSYYDFISFVRSTLSLFCLFARSPTHFHTFFRAHTRHFLSSHVFFFLNPHYFFKTKPTEKVSLLPNLQVRAHCDSGEYPGQSAYVVHCKIPRTQKPTERMALLTKYGLWLLRENFQFVEYPGNFEAWLDVVIDTRSLAYTVMTNQNNRKGFGGLGGGGGGGGLFSVGAKATPTLVNLNRAPVVPLQNQPGVSPGNRGGAMRMGIGMAGA
jgi:hypothetical protein